MVMLRALEGLYFPIVSDQTKQTNGIGLASVFIDILTT